MIVVTGGTGFLGATLLYYLLRQPQPIRATHRASSSFDEAKFIFQALDHLSEGNHRQQQWEDIEWVEADVLEPAALEEAFADAQQVYHTAAMVSFHPKDRWKVRHTNITGTANVVNAAIEQDVRKLAFVSSIGALDKQPEKMLDEEAWVEEQEFGSVYSESKYYSEMEVWRGVAEGLPSVVVNPGIILGPGDFSKGSDQMFKSVADGLKFYSQGSSGFVDSRDVAKATIALMESEIEDERYVLVSENRPIRWVLDHIADCLQQPRPKTEAKRWMSELLWRFEKVRSLVTGSRPFITEELAQSAQTNYYFSSEKVKRDLDWQFIPLEQTIREACNSFRLWEKKQQ